MGIRLKRKTHHLVYVLGLSLIYATGCESEDYTGLFSQKTVAATPVNFGTRMLSEKVQPQQFCVTQTQDQFKSQTLQASGACSIVNPTMTCTAGNATCPCTISFSVDTSNVGTCGDAKGVTFQAFYSTPNGETNAVIYQVQAQVSQPPAIAFGTPASVPDPGCAGSTGPYDFGTCFLGQSPLPNPKKTVTVTNTSQNMTMTGLAFVTDQAAPTGIPFGAVGLPSTLGPGQQATITVSYSPTTQTPISLTLSVTYQYQANGNVTQAQSSPLKFTAQSVGAAKLALLASCAEGSAPVTTLNFGTGVSGMPITKTLGLVNQGPSASGAITLNAGALGSQFTTPQSSWTSLAPGACASIPITWALTATGTKSGSLAITYNTVFNGKTAATIPMSPVPITGNAITPASLVLMDAACANQVSEAEFTPLNLPGSETLTLCFKNAGQNTSAAMNLALSSTSAYSLSPGSCTSSTTLASGASCTFTLTFNPPGTPQSDGTFNGSTFSNQGISYAITGSALNPAKLAIFQGVCPSSTAPASPLSIGSVTAWTTAATSSVCLTNTGDLTANLLGYTYGDPQFTTATSGTGCSQVLAPGATCVLAISFLPLGVGTFTSSLSVAFSSGSAGIPQPAVALPISGTGTTPPPVNLTDQVPYSSSASDNSVWVATRYGSTTYAQAYNISTISPFAQLSWNLTFTNPYDANGNPKWIEMGIRTFVVQDGALFSQYGNLWYVNKYTSPQGNVIAAIDRVVDDTQDHSCNNDYCRTCVVSYQYGGQDYVGMPYWLGSTLYFAELPLNKVTITMPDGTLRTTTAIGPHSALTKTEVAGQSNINKAYGFYSCAVNQTTNVLTWANWANANATSAGNVYTLSLTPNSSGQKVYLGQPQSPNRSSMYMYALGRKVDGTIITGNPTFSGSSYPYTAAHESSTNNIVVSNGQSGGSSVIDVYPGTCSGDLATNCSLISSFSVGSGASIGPLSSLNNGSVVGLGRQSGEVHLFTLTNPSGNQPLKVQDQLLAKLGTDPYMYVDFAGSMTFANPFDQVIDLTVTPGYLKPAAPAPARPPYNIGVTWTQSGAATSSTTWNNLILQARCASTAVTTLAAATEALSSTELMPVASSGGIPLTAPGTVVSLSSIPSCSGTGIRWVELSVTPANSGSVFSPTEYLGVSFTQ
jgi:hypothetical protein